MSITHVRPSNKGQITLPVTIRRKLNVGPNTILDVSIENGDRIVLKPIHLDALDDNLRIYSSEEIDQFLEDDKLSPEDAAFFDKLLKRNQ